MGTSTLKILYVDDKFPVDENNQSVFCKVITDHGASEFWPILLEKAYAKLAEPDFVRVLPPPRRSCARRSDLFVGR